MLEENLLQNEMLVDIEAINHLKEIALWAKFLSIAGFAGSGIMAFIGMFAGTLISQFSPRLQSGGNTELVAGAIMVLYVILGIILFIMFLYLYKFAIKMQLALKLNDQENLNYAFYNLKIYYRFAGILTIIYMVFLFLALLGMMVMLVAAH